jgi:hypothetical protein
MDFLLFLTLNDVDTSSIYNPLVSVAIVPFINYYALTITVPQTVNICSRKYTADFHTGRFGDEQIAKTVLNYHEFHPEPIIRIRLPQNVHMQCCNGCHLTGAAKLKG